MAQEPQSTRQHLAQALLLGLFLLMMGGAVTLVVQTGRPSGVEVLLPTPTPQPTVQVHIGGAVARPGRYTLPVGARLGDALDAAGGPLEGANLNSLNLARPLADGEKITVPLVVQREEAHGQETTASLQSSGLLDLNTADIRTLETLPGIGPVLAQRIVDYRMRYGPFTRVEDLLQVPGIGQKTLERIRPFVMVK